METNTEECIMKLTWIMCGMSKCKRDNGKLKSRRMQDLAWIVEREQK
jgi:hypothetical protein